MLIENDIHLYSEVSFTFNEMVSSSDIQLCLHHLSQETHNEGSPSIVGSLAFSPADQKPTADVGF